MIWKSMSLPFINEFTLIYLPAKEKIYTLKKTKGLEKA